MATVVNPPRRSGRPRSAEADRAIVETAAQVLRDEGYGAMSVERIASMAGVGKTTIYRRYRNRRELAAAAAEHMSEFGPFDIPGDTDTQTALRETLRHAIQAVSSAAVLAMLGTLVAERRENRAHLERFWRHVFAPYEKAVGAALQRSANVGEVAKDAAVEVVPELLSGALLARTFSGRPITPDWTDSVVETIWRGIRLNSRGAAQTPIRRKDK